MSKKKYHDEGWLKEQYFELGKNGMTIADEQDVHYTTIYDWMERHGIERRSASEAKLGERNSHYGKSRPDFAEKMEGSKNPSYKDGRSKDEDFRTSAKWDNFSFEMKERADWTCENCGAHGSDSEIHTHHAYPVSEGGDKYDNVFIVLCKSCHGNKSSFWHNSTVGEQVAKIGGEPAAMV